MSSSLLSKSLGEVKNQEKPVNGRGGARPNRNSPYARPTADGWKHDRYAATVDVLPSQRLDKSGREKKSAKLKITNLHYEVSERELELLFLQIGPLALPPKIIFDRSGRSSGIAFVAYTSEEDAAKAKVAFNGAPAKGENITVEFDYRVTYAPPAPGTLLARLEQESRPKRGDSSRPVAQRINSVGRGGGVPKGTPKGPAALVKGGRGGATVSRGVSTRGGRGGRGGAAVGGGRKAKVPATTGDLDKELEDFLAVTPSTVVVPAVVASEAAVSIPEVEMS